MSRLLSANMLHYFHLGMPGGGIARTARQGFHQNMGMFNELRERN
jgi:hypothetical protein